MTVSSLDDRVAFVTGAGGGIGTAIARRLNRGGARLGLFDLPDSGQENLAAELAGSGGEVRCFTVDVRDAGSVEAAVAAAAETLGGVDVLVNNAGIAPMEPFLDCDVELYDRVMAINARGSFVFAQQVARRMVDAGGAIVQIASICAFESGAIRNCCVYNMSKAAVRQMVASLAGELARYRIRVNGVAPGSIDTEMTRRLLPTEEDRAKVARTIPWRQLGTPDDVASAVAFLASEEARYITGQTLLVDGGWLVG